MKINKNIALSSLLSLALLFTSVNSCAIAKTLKDIDSNVIKFEEIVKIGEKAIVPTETTVSSVVSFGDDVYVSGEVVKDAVSVGGNVFLSPDSKVLGNVVSIGGTVSKDTGAKVAGTIKEISIASSMTGSHGFFWKYMTSIFSNFIFYVCIALIGIFGGLVFPKRIGWTGAAIEHNPLKAFLIGLLWIALFLPIALLLLLSIIGIPLLNVQFIFYGLALVLGYISALQVIGKKTLSIVKKFNQPIIIEIVFGTAIMLLIGIIPFLGQFINFIIGITAIGACYMSRFGEGI